ncbi:MAG TPA: FecR domain-containing protein [Candidatus Acidoferrum sp.]|nr:FecR domain-containing protein [Candidatus Acidoferrum sp.]
MIAAPGSVRILANTCQVLILFTLALACTAQSARAQVTPVEARIASVSGTALLSSGAQAPTAAKRGDVLFPGEEIDTRGGGHLTIELTDGSLVVVRPGSRVLLKDFRAANTLRELFEVLLGRVRVRINHFGGKPNPYRVNSPTASIAVRGTEFSVAVNGVGDTEVIVYEGLVEVTSLSNPQNKVLVHPGQGVIVRPNQDIHFFASSPTGEIGGLGGDQNLEDSTHEQNAGTSGDPEDSANANSPRNSAGIYDRFVENVVDARQGPLFLRFTAYPDSFLDGLENPAYATEFSAPEGRVFLLPSFRGSQGVGATQSAFFSSPGKSVDYSLSPQGSFFTPLSDHRTAIGGGVAAFQSGVQSFTLDDASSLSGSLFPAGTTGTRASSDSTNTSFLSGAFAVAHAFGEEKRTSVGLGLDYVKGWGSLLNFVTQQDAAGNVASERIDSKSNLSQTRIKAGVSHDFSRERKLGIYYSYGFVSADFGNASHTLNGQPQSLDTTQSAGRSSEVGIRFRGVLTKKLFYGAQASWFLLSLDDQLKLSTIVNSHQHDRTTGSSFAAGFGYALRPRVVFTLDLAGGFSKTTTMRTEDATGNILERNRRSSPFLSAHEAIQADVWRHLFVSGSLLTVRQTLSTNLALHQDRFGRLLTSDGTFAPNGLTRDRSTTYYSEFGAGWRFTDNFLAEYVFSTNYGVTQPSYVFLLRYSFRVREH